MCTFPETTCPVGERFVRASGASNNFTVTTTVEKDGE